MSEVVCYYPNPSGAREANWEEVLMDRPNGRVMVTPVDQEMIHSSLELDGTTYIRSDRRALEMQVAVDDSLGKVLYLESRDTMIPNSSTRVCYNVSEFEQGIQKILVGVNKVFLKDGNNTFELESKNNRRDILNGIRKLLQL